MRKLTAVAMLAASAATSACASLGPALENDAHGLSWDDVRNTPGAVLLADQPAPAPPGLVEFCARSGDCASVRPHEQSAVSLANDGDRLLIDVVWDDPQAGMAVPLRGPSGEASDLFHRMLAAREQGAAFHYAHDVFTLTEARWRELGSVNRAVNHAIAGASDFSQYGVSEYWAMPITEPLHLTNALSSTAQGDCEDYALEKRARLISLGWRADVLALAVAEVPGSGMHAVLTVQTDHGDFVLDNLGDEPRRVDARAYRWVSRQADQSMTAWAGAHVQATPPEAPRQVLLQAALTGEGGARPRPQHLALLSRIVDPVS